MENSPFLIDILARWDHVLKLRNGVRMDWEQMIYWHYLTVSRLREAVQQ